MNFIVVIPARFFSNRLPGKPLIDINGKPMIVRIMELAQVSGAVRVIVATDHLDVVNVIKRVGGEVCLTGSNYQFGTERLAEVINRYKFPDDQIIVNVQGDEPFIPPNIICQVANHLPVVDAKMVTLAVPITTTEETSDSNVVKVVINAYGYALYFSRAAIPWNQNRSFSFQGHEQIYGNKFLLRHVGLYAYYADFIHRYVSWKPSPLEKIELLEQLRVLWYGEKIFVTVENMTPDIISINTPEDLKRARLRQLVQ